MQESLESVKSIPIQQVARRLGLEVIGQSARCFSHKPDRNPSLRLNLNTNRYHCYVCRGIYGSVIDLVMQVLGCDFKEAVSYLRGERQPLPPARPRRSEAERPVLSAERKGELLEAFMKFAPMQEEGMDYLRSRGLKTEIIEQMKIGYLRPGQYASASYREKLAGLGIQVSMSRSGDCYDNAVVESFFGTLKQELVHDARWKTHAEARAAIHDYIEVFYNRRRLHSSLGYLSPADFEAQCA